MTADGAATVVDAISSLLWPVLVLIALLLLYKPISTMIRNIKVERSRLV